MNNNDRFQPGPKVVNPDLVETPTRFYYDMPMEYRVARSEARIDLLNDQFNNIMTAIRNLRWWIIGSLLVGIGIVVACAAYQATWVQTYVEKAEAANRAHLEQSETANKVLLERSEAANKAFFEKSEAANRALLEEMDKRWQAINAEQQKRHDENMRELRSLHGK